MTIHEYGDVITARLALIAMTPAMLLSEKAADGRLGKLIGCAVPANWPPEHWEPHVFEVLLTQFERHPEQMAWQRYVALPEPDGRRRLIGSVGAFWRETSPAECEIGYSILPPFEGRGLATEAARALIALIAEDARITSVMAHTYPRLGGSVRVMERCGMVYEGPGEEVGTVRYRLRLR